ncbi:gamma-aminobutyric acid receptor subunit pi-like isoform X2 [Lampetra fluviatilis]
MWDAVVRAPLLMPLLLMLSGQSEPSPRHAETLPPTVQKLMKGYNRYLRPSFEEGSVVVGMSLDIASIDSISEINMDYTATIFLRQRWVDERLCFDANKSLSLDGRLVELLWVPDTFIVDSKRSFLHAVTVENRLIRIFPNGTVLYALRITATVACNMDLTKYPMDKQSCTLQLESWGYNTDDMVFYWTRGNDSVRGLENLRLAQYTVEEQFTSVSEAVYETGRYPKLVFHFVLRRNILYFILETYVPSILLVVLSWVSFWISQSSVPARICIGVTTVLTMTTLMMGARASLPNANCFIKAIDVYLGICFSFIFGALLETTSPTTTAATGTAASPPSRARTPTRSDPRAVPPPPDPRPSGTRLHCRRTGADHPPGWSLCPRRLRGPRPTLQVAEPAVSAPSGTLTTSTTTPGRPSPSCLYSSTSSTGATTCSSDFSSSSSSWREGAFPPAWPNFAHGASRERPARTTARGRGTLYFGEQKEVAGGVSIRSEYKIR